MEELDFKCYLILIFLNQEKLGYNTYSLIKLLSVNYNILEQLFNILLEMDLIEEDPDTLQYKLTENGHYLLFSNHMNNVNLDNLDSHYIEKDKKNFMKNKSKYIFYIPRNFNL